MKNIPFNPFSGELPVYLQDLRGEFDKWIDRVWHGGISTAPLDGQDWAPNLDVFDLGTHYLVRVEVPGLTSGDIEVTIHEGVLNVKGHKPPPVPPGKPPKTLRCECRYGAFARRFPLPGAVAEDAIKATCKEGVLTIEIPRQPEPKGRTVKVEPGA